MPTSRRLYLSCLIAALLVVVPALLARTFPARAGQAQQYLRFQPVRRDVTYCTAGGVDLKLDLYRQSGVEAGQSGRNSPVPAVMFVHGGSWSSGDKASGEGALEIDELVSRGYLVASVNYRLAPSYVFPAQTNDVKCAVRYLRANSAALGLDPGRIGAWGASAGGHLVSLLGTADSSAGMEGDGGYQAQSSRVQAVVDMYGRADLTSIPQTRPDLLPVFGGQDNLVRYSPVTYVSADDPPFLILHGEKDTTVPPQLSQEFYARLRGAGVPATLVIVKNAGHGFAPDSGDISPTRTEITRMVADFFDRYLKGGSTVNAASAPLVAAPLPSGGATLFFAQTGKTVRGKFLDYWRSHGAVAQLGYPISGEFAERSPQDRKAYTVQYFERAVLEYHAENQPPYDVLQSLLGLELYKQKYPGAHGAPGQRPNTSNGSVLFKQTGCRLGGAFQQYWQQNGAVTQFGYPISDEFVERNEATGKDYLVQYFERQRLELHPENKGTPYEVLSGRLGAERATGLESR